MQRRYQVWVDASGFTRLTLLNTAAGAGAIVTQMLAVSHADVLNTVDATLTVNLAPAPSTGTYQNIADAAGLIYADAMGRQVTLQLPAPLSTIFFADQVTVNPAAIAALNGAVIGTLLTTAGAVVTAFVGGTRRPITRENYQ